jgi:hypothetical protein
MKTFNCKFLFIFAVASVLCTSTVLLGDWNPGEPYKMHAPQLPDPNGWDVCLMHQFIADDFMCTETGPITDIHFWTSWQQDNVGWIEGWYVAIYSDDHGWPGTSLWAWNGVGNLNIRPYSKGTQGWRCPPPQNEQVFVDHNSTYQVNITNIPEPFFQQQGQIYWLVIHATAMPTPKSDPPGPTPAAVGWTNSVAAPPGNLWGSPASFSSDLKTWSRVTIDTFFLQYVDMSFVITSSLDYGDAPAPYPTLRANDGARHIVVPDILMGALIDSEPDGQPNANATGDDITNLADEDGVSFLTPLIPGQMATVSVDLSNCTAGIPLFLNAWIDFNGNGSWADSADRIFFDQMLTGGSVYNLSFQVPFNAKPDTTTYARFRLCTMRGLSYTGLATDGEVEDYTVSIGKFPLTEHLKWSQPPLEIDPLSEIPLYCGWNQPSYSQDMEHPLVGIGAADDFRCIGPMPITSLHFWGSYMEWKNPEPPGMEPLAWSITFWTNSSPMPPGFSHPGMLLWDIVIPNERVKTQYAGEDFFPITPPESCFRYDLDLTSHEYFWQQDYNDLSPDNVYWIGIKALYPITIIPIENPWGWKTRPQHWMDDAVRSECIMLPNGMLDCIHTPLEDPLTGESYDLAFELDTDPAYIKWEQPYTGLRDWPHYEDQVSMAKEEVSGDLTIIRQVADDWKCEKRTPVTSIVFWGSYLNYTYIPCEPAGLPTPVKPDFFLISIFTDVPANDPCNPYGFSHPGNKVWEYRARNYDEVLVGYDKNQFVNPPGQEAVFRYSVRLPEEEWFKQRKVNQIYWVGIMAVNGPNHPPTYQWGWTNHKHKFNDDAVAGTLIPGSPLLKWQELYDQTGKSADQSFVLFTDPRVCVDCADYDFSGMVTFYDFAIFALDWRDYGLPGGLYNADLDCNGIVNEGDLEIFCSQWLQSCK